MKRLLIVFPNMRIPFLLDTCSELDVEVVAVIEPGQQAISGPLIDSGRLMAFEEAEWRRACSPKSRLIDRFAEMHAVDGILTADEPTVAAVAAATHRLELAGPSVESVLAARSKERRAAVLADANLSPRQVALPLGAPPAEFVRAFEALGRDVVVKPASGYAGTGVTRVVDFSSLLFAVAHVERLYDGILAVESRVEDEDGRTISGVVIEEFLTGSEFAVETAVDASGRAVAVAWGSKGRACGPHFQEAPYVSPGRLDPEAADGLFAAAEGACMALGLNSTMAHVELRVDAPGQFKVIDLGPRVGGSGVVDWLSRRAFGVSVCQTAIGLALGDEVALSRPGPPTLVAANFVIPVGDAGTFAGIDGLDRALDARRATFLPLMDLGARIPAWPTWGGYVGFVLSEHDDFAQVEELHGLLEREVFVRCDP